MDEDSKAIPLNMRTLRMIAGPDFDEDSKAIETWIRGGAEPAFAEIAVRLIAIHEELARRGWYQPDEYVRDAVESVRAGLAEERTFELRGRVARLVEITRGLLENPRPNPRAAAARRPRRCLWGRRRHSLVGRVAHG